MTSNSKIYIAGHNGMVGSAVIRQLEKEGYINLIYASKNELNLKNQTDVEIFFERKKPEIVVIAAAKVGGIKSNIDFPGDYIYDNLTIQNNLIECSRKFKVNKLVFLGSSCIYPKKSPQPMKENYIFSGKLEPTNEGYAVAKLAGIKLLEAYKKQYNLKSITIIPPNMYGPNDSFDLKNCHVLSALIRRMSDAKRLKLKNVTLWGNGNARREFMHVDDLAKAVMFFLKNRSNIDLINIGTGIDISIKELAQLIKSKVGYRGDILWDKSKPNGMLRKCMDISNMKKIGFTPKISLEEGIEQVINIYEKDLEDR